MWQTNDLFTGMNTCLLFSTSSWGIFWFVLLSRWGVFLSLFRGDCGNNGLFCSGWGCPAGFRWYRSGTVPPLRAGQRMSWMGVHACAVVRCGHLRGRGGSLTPAPPVTIKHDSPASINRTRIKPWLALIQLYLCVTKETDRGRRPSVVLYNKAMDNALTTPLR